MLTELMEENQKSEPTPNEEFQPASDDQANDEHENHCAIIYGALPPQSKKSQALMFNNREGTSIKYLVATDAIGMGLNLAI